MRTPSDKTKLARIRELYERSFELYESFNEPEGLGTQLFYLAGAIATDQSVLLRREGVDSEKELIRWFTDPECWPRKSWISRYVKITEGCE